MQQPRLHFHSDCDFFAGCESMLVNFLGDDRLAAGYQVSFSYRGTPRYVQGLRQRMAPLVQEQPLPLLSDAGPRLSSGSRPALLTWALRIGFELLLIRYWIWIWNVGVLLRAWRGRDIDILHVNNGGYPGASSARAAAVAARLLGIRRVVMVVNNMAEPCRLHERWAEWLVNRWTASSVDTFVTGSAAAGVRLRGHLGERAARFACLHNGIGERHPDESAAATRQRLGIPAQALLIVMVALHEERKGHRVLIDAVAELNRMLPTQAIRPLFAFEGSGPLEATLRQQVAILGLEHQVLFTGSERNVFNLLQCADLLAVPSIGFEDFPNVILEAMSLGKPVLASALAGIPEQVVEGSTGWLVPPGDVQALAHALYSIVQDTGILRQVGENARARFAGNFTASVAVGRYLQLYADMLDRPAPA